MPTLKQRRARYIKSLGLASIILSGVFLSIEGVMIYSFWITPKATTIFLHFNFQYRAGQTEIENNIIEEPYYKMLQMFDRHPNWNFTVEMQAAMIERMMENETRFGAILNLTRKLNHRGQMEISCAFYSSQIVHAYPQDVVEWDFRHAYDIFQAANLTRSRILLCQEGQAMLGFANVFNTSYAEGVDTLLASWQQLRAFSPPGHVFPDSPIYISEDVVPNKKMYLLNYDYLPKIEAGFMHSWMFAADAELAVDQSDPEIEFDVDPARLADFEQQWLLLEREGNNFFTMEDWVNHCIKVGAVQTLDFYMPEVHWGPGMYNSSYKWMGDNSACSDDGEMIANNLRGFFTVKATRILYNKYKNMFKFIANRTYVESYLDKAEKLVLLSMVTDTTGINPKGYERYYGEKNIYDALLNCSNAISIIIKEIPELAPYNKFQVDLKAQTAKNISDSFSVPILQAKSSLSELPFSINADTIPYRWSLIPTTKVNNFSFDGYDYQSLEVEFQGSWDWLDDSYPKTIRLTLNVDASKIIYCPSLTDSLKITRNMSRSDYQTDPIYVWLPLSNGLVFIPNSENSDVGLAIVNNCSKRHTTLLWEENYLRYIEVGGIHSNATYQIFVINNIKLEEAVNFAQRVNTMPLWTVSDDIKGMGSYYIYKRYNQIDNVGQCGGEEGWWEGLF